MSHRKGRCRILGLSKNELDRRVTSESQEQTISADKLDQRRVVPDAGCKGSFRTMRIHTDGMEVTSPVGEDGHEDKGD